RGCLWFRPAEVGDIAFRARFLASNPQFRRALGLAGREHCAATRSSEVVAAQYDATGDCKPQPGTALTPRIGGVDLVEAFEDALAIFDWNATTWISHLELDVFACNCRFDPNLASRIGKLDGIAQQISEALHDAVAIGIDGCFCRR